jgi:hypothetical protein
MASTLRSSAVATLFVAGLVAVSGASGAVAGSMITGKDIKNGSITTKDLKDGSITAKDVKDGSLTANVKDNSVSSQHVVDGSLGAGDLSAVAQNQLRQVGGYQAVHQTSLVNDGDGGSVVASCPGDTRIIGTAAWWGTALTGPQVAIHPVEGYSRTATAYSENGQTFDDTLHLTLFCGRVSAG